MWELKFKLKFFWSLLVFLNSLDKPIPIEALGADSDLDVVSNGGVDWDWMQTGKLGMLEGGQWLRPSFCPAGSFVTGYQIKYGQKQGNAAGEITGLKLHCSKLDQNYKLKTTGSLDANGASISNENENSVSVTSNQQAVGFSMARWTNSKGFELVDGRRLKFHGEDASEKYRFRFPNGTNSTLLVNIGCPEDWAICGMQAREKNAQEHEQREPILTQLRFKCCYYCLPQEKRVILDDYTNPGSTDYSRTIRRTVGTQIDRRRSKSGSNSESSDRTKETQNGNSRSLSSSQSESEGTTDSSSTGTSDSRGWITGEELRISSSSQNSKDSRVSDSISLTESDSRSIGRSRAQTDSNHWSQTRGTSSSSTTENSLEVGANFGFSGFGVTAGVSVNARESQSQTNGQHEESTSGGSSQTQHQENEDNTHTSGSGTNKETSTGASNTDTNGKDKSKNKGESGGTSLSREQSRQRSIQRAKDRSIQEGAQSMFTQRQADQRSWQFNWDQGESSMWREEREDTYSFTCEAMHRCIIEQVYGTCGALRIGSTKIEKKPELLKYGMYGGNPEPEVETTSNKTKEIQWDIQIPGETWVVAKDLSHWTPSGRWENVQVCPPDTIVTGHMFKYLPQIGHTGILLICSGKYGPDEGDKEHDSEDVHILRISSEDEPDQNRTRGPWGVLTRGSRSIFAEGYSFAQMEMNGRRWIGNQEIVYQNIDLMKIPPKMAVNSSRVVTKCPEDHAICGLTVMKDEFGIGVVTALGFKCCHHCIPEEKWITVHEYINESPSDEVREVRTTVGVTRTHTVVESNSVNTGATTDSAGITREGLHAGFSARFGKSNSTGFDWSHTKTSIWNDETTVTERFVCEGFHYCVYRELAGQCGSVRVRVDKFQKVSTSIKQTKSASDQNPDSSETVETETEISPDQPSGFPASSSRQAPVYPNQYNLEDEPTPVQVLKNGEIWIEAQNIQIQNSEETKIWGPSESCPPGTFVTGFRLKKLGGEDKNTKELLNGLELQCSKWNAHGNFQQVKMIQGGQRSSSSRPGRSFSNPDESQGQDDSSSLPAVGFHLFFYEWFDEEEKLVGQGTTGHSLIFNRWSTPPPPSFTDSEYEVKVVPEKVLCPTDYVICGVRTRKDGDTGILTDIKFQCCYHCEPSETEDILDTQENPTDVSVTHAIPHVSIGAVLEVKNPIVEGSTPNTFTLTKGFSDYLYIREMFAHRLPKTSKKLGTGQPRIEWKKLHKGLWTKEAEMSKSNICTPGNRCVVSQVVGLCGKLRIPTSFTPTRYTLIGAEEEEQEEEDDH